jgi:general secretion pathway protein E
VRARIVGRADAATLRQHARAHGMATLREDGIAKVLDGTTTIAEVLRVTRDDGA